jgi:hypothetical protein
MAVLSIFKILGDPDELFAMQQEKIAPAAREYAANNGGIAHFTARTDDGLLIVNAWETADAAQGAGEAIMPIAREAGVSQSDYQQYEILNHETH